MEIKEIVSDKKEIKKTEEKTEEKKEKTPIEEYEESWHAQFELDADSELIEW